jgi:hypothetical protein
MNVYVWTNSLKNAYIGEYPLEETYTIPKVTSSSSSYVWDSVQIYKAWYKIKNILIETTAKSTNTSQPTSFIVLAQDGSEANIMQIYCWAGSNLSTQFTYKYSWSYTTISSSLGTMSSWWTNILSLNMTDEWVVTTIVNWTTNTFTLTWNSKTALNNILNWTSILSSIVTRYYWEIWPATVTVTYTPNS